jgi:uncharacterized delta-60 repeat protein
MTGSASAALIPDNSFGIGGTAAVSFSGDSDILSGAAIEPDGKVVIAGLAGMGTGEVGVSRLNSDGSLDPTFSGDGKLTLPLDNEAGTPEVAVQPDGKIIIAADSGTELNQDFTATRLNSDGSLDTSFGTGGTSTADFNGQQDIVSSLVIQPDGKIVVAGSANYGGPMQCVASVPAMAFARLNANGSLDTSFGTGGKTTVTRTTCAAGDSGSVADIALQSDGKIVAVGNWDDAKAAAIRLGSNGSLDASFGVSGKTILDPVSGHLYLATSVVVQPDGKLDIAANSWGSIDSALVLRLNGDASVDDTFGDSGKTAVNSGGINIPDGLSDIALQPDGTIVTVGTARSSSPSADFDFGVVRLNASGAIEESNGFDFGANSSDDVTSLAIQPDGKLVLAGMTGNSFGILRLTTGNAAPPAPQPAPVDVPPPAITRLIGTPKLSSKLTSISVNSSCAQQTCVLRVTVVIGGKKYRLPTRTTRPSPAGETTLTKVTIPKKVRKAIQAAKKKHKIVRVAATIS